VAAGDAHRRADQLGASEAALAQAAPLWAALGEQARGAVVAAERAAVAVERGDAAGARSLLAPFGDAPLPEGVRAVVFDGLAGIALLQGDLDDARAWVDRLGASAPPGARPAVAFRRAALARLDGSLEAARQLLAGALEGAGAGLAWAGPRAAAAHEVGEIDLLVGRMDAARHGFGVAEAEWRAAGRASGALRAACGRVRAALGAGEGLGSIAWLDAAISAAGEAVLLRAELLGTRGQARAGAGDAAAGAADLDAAIALAAAAGAPGFEGRLRARRAGAGLAGGDAARTRACLGGDRPWLAGFLAGRRLV
jgi:hypothetical protein